MTAESRYPISSFGPEFLETLRKAARERIVLEFPTYRLAVRFQHRIYTLRSQMQKQKHELYPLVSRVRSSLTFGKKAGYADTPVKVTRKNVTIPLDTNCPAKIELYPYDMEFRDIVAKAGIIVRPEASLVPEPISAPSIDEIIRQAKED